VSRSFPPTAYPAIAGTFAVQTVVAAAMFGVAVLAPVAAADLSVDPTLIGAFTAIAYAAGMLAGLLTGGATRKFGAIRVCQSTMFLTVLGLVLIGAPSLWAVGLSAISLGLGYGAVNPVTTDILNRVSTERWRSLIFSIKQTGMPTGAALAGVSLPLLTVWFGWELALVTIAVVALLTAGGIESLRARFDVTVNRQHRLGVRTVLAPVVVTWNHRSLRKLAMAGYIYAGCQVSLTTYFVVFLVSENGMSLTLAGIVFTVLQMSAVAGRIFWGACAGWRIGASSLLALLGVLTGLLAMVFGYIGSALPLWSLIVMTVLFGTTSHGWNGVFFAEVARTAPASSVAEAAGGAQFTSLFGVTTLPPLFGVLAYVGSYTLAFGLLGTAMLLAGLFLFWRRQD